MSCPPSHAAAGGQRDRQVVPIMHDGKVIEDLAGKLDDTDLSLIRLEADENGHGCTLAN